MSVSCFLAVPLRAPRTLFGGVCDGNPVAVGFYFIYITAKLRGILSWRCGFAVPAFYGRADPASGHGLSSEPVKITIPIF